MLPVATTRQLLAHYTADLPADLLQEVLDYVQFLRHKRLGLAVPDAPNAALAQGRQHEWQHLEEEFADFDQRFPVENPRKPTPGGAPAAPAC